jgi:hypothetical protein
MRVSLKETRTSLPNANNLDGKSGIRGPKKNFFNCFSSIQSQYLRACPNYAFPSNRIKCRYRLAWPTSRMICSFNNSGDGQRRSSRRRR